MPRVQSYKRESLEILGAFFMTRGRPFIDGRPNKLIVLCPDVCGVGWDFRMGGVAEAAFRNLPLEWDAVSR